MQIDLNWPGAQGPPYNQPGSPTQLRVPFVTESTGLGDAIKRLTSAMGISPCSKCEERAQTLNNSVRLTPWEW